MWLLNQMLTRVIRTGRLVIIDYDGKTYEYGADRHGLDSKGPIRVRMADKGAARHIARYPQIGAGEAYMDRRMIIEPPHDIRDLVLFVTENGKPGDGEDFKAHGLLRRVAQDLIARIDSFNPPGKAVRNAKHTYNLTRRLFELFLDEDRQYTMAYYRDHAAGTSLEQAQLDKKAHLAAKMYIQPDAGKPMKVLDIGCGWGGFALYLNKHYGCEVLGVALAEDQVAFCKERAAELGVADKVKFELMDYRSVEGTFDRISTVGLLEHVGTPHYPIFYQHTNRLLKADGIMLSHSCGRAQAPGFTDAWTRKYIFPGGYIPSLSELVTQAERAGWQVMDVEAMRFHYSHTLEEWYRRTVMHEREITELYDERFFRMWQYYLAGAEQAFRNGKMVNWQMIYVKDRNAIPMTRDWIVEESARLRASDVAPVWRFDAGLREAAE